MLCGTYKSVTLMVVRRSGIATFILDVKSWKPRTPIRLPATPAPSSCFTALTLPTLAPGTERLVPGAGLGGSLEVTAGGTGFAPAFLGQASAPACR